MGRVADITRFFGAPRSTLLEFVQNEDRIPVAYTCTLVPEVLLTLGRLSPIRISARDVTGTEIADIYMGALTCSYTRSVLEAYLDDAYEDIQGWVFATGCDHMRRLYSNMKYLRSPKFIHMLDVPHKTDRLSIDWYAEELRAFTESLRQHFDIDISQDAISLAIDRFNQFQSVMQSICQLRKDASPPLSGTEFSQLISAARSLPRDVILDALVNYRDALLAREGNGEKRPRLLLVGGHLDDHEYVRTIEALGGVVVAERTCTGSIPGTATIQREGDPLTDIASHTLRQSLCPRMMHRHDLRLDTILKTIQEYRVDGVIIEVVKFCDTWAIDANFLSAALRNRSIPVLLLEREYRHAGEGQLRTRVQAFQERMGR